MKKISTVLSVFILLTVCAFGQSSGNIILKKGQKFLVENKMTVSSTQQIMGQEIPSTGDFFTSNNFEVKDVTDNNYSLTNTFTKVTASMSAAGQNMNFDSDKPEDMSGEMGSGMKDFINHPKDIMIDNGGKVLNEDKADSVSKGSTGMMNTMLKQFLGNSDEAGLNTFRILPKDAHAGYNWSDSSSADGVKKVTKYNIKDIKGSEATLIIDGTLETDTKTEMHGMQVNSKTKGTVKGEEKLDVETGIVKQRTTTVESSGKVEAMGQEIPMSTKLTTLTTIKNI